MRITDIDVVLHERTASPALAVFGVTDGNLPLGVLTIHTDEGVEGHNFLSFPGPGPESIARQIVTYLKPLLVGRDPLDIGALGALMTQRDRFVDPIAIGTIDVALWDIAGKVAGLPVHRLLGTVRDRIPVYYSSGMHERPEDYAEEARHWQDLGWRGYKLHPPSAPWSTTSERRSLQRDIDACMAVRDAVGDEMELILDASWAYSYPEALAVGHVIQELRYAWYEDPLHAEDIYGYTKLKRYLHIPILATETTLGGLYALPQWIVQQATDALRGDVVLKGGITGMMKIAHLAEAFRMSCEVHDAYNAMNNVASLHVVMAIPNCDWFEVLGFNRAGCHSLEHLNYGLGDPIEIDDEGFAHAPTAPGLGVEIDWELIDSARAGVIR
ncbi:MAG TPA: enolase C-terminal domain-like protein [Solirubrobacteraceae bacterium]|jgi:L-alanine-DL-glutamate epimerase-like enolase superfamily enzyme|nr:enolase C-terminal domain-like protein [Solirubrobacteraceae bacterium]